MTLGEGAQDVILPGKKARRMREKLLAGLLACMVGCVSAQTFKSGSGKVYPRTKTANVLVYYSAPDVKEPYEVIGEITTAGSSGWGQNEGSLIKKARSEAAKLGADAIILRLIDNGTGGDRAMAVLFGSNDRRQQITAIRFTRSDP